MKFMRAMGTLAMSLKYMLSALMYTLAIFGTLSSFGSMLRR